MFIAESVSKEVFKIGEYLAKLRARTWLSRALYAPGHSTAKMLRKCTQDTRPAKAKSKAVYDIRY